MPSPPDRIRETQARYRKKNHAEILKRRREIYASDVEAGRARLRAYRKANPDKVNDYNAKWRKRFYGALRAELIAAYGGACECCGESEPIFLDVDHPNNDGKAHRAETGNSQRMMVSLKREGWPKRRVRLLCCNCNQGRQRNGGTCPHRRKS